MIDRALAKSPADRYDSCGAMAKALEVSLSTARMQRGTPEPEPEPEPADPPTEQLAGAALPLPRQPASLRPSGSPWWTVVDRSAGLTGIAAALLSLVALFPPTAGTQGSGRRNSPRRVSPPGNSPRARAAGRGRAAAPDPRAGHRNRSLLFIRAVALRSRGGVRARTH